MRKPNQGLNQLVQIFLVLSLVILMGFKQYPASAKATEPPRKYCRTVPAFRPTPQGLPQVKPGQTATVTSWSLRVIANGACD